MPSFDNFNFSFDDYCDRSIKQLRFRQDLRSIRWSPKIEQIGSPLMRSSTNDPMSNPLQRKTCLSCSRTPQTGILEVQISPASRSASAFKGYFCYITSIILAHERHSILDRIQSLADRSGYVSARFDDNNAESRAASKKTLEKIYIFRRFVD